MAKDISYEINIDDDKKNAERKKERVEKKEARLSAIEGTLKNNKAKTSRNAIADLSSDGLKKAFVLSEILQKPLALRRRK